MKKLIISIIIGVAFFAGAGEAHAQDSVLQQEIQPPACDQPGECEMDPPVVGDVNINGGRPIFTGTYDAAYTKYLRVTFNGKTYTLGIDGELTVSNGRWRLDLSGLSRPLAPGTYSIVVEAEDAEGNVLRDTMTIRITEDDIDDGGDDDQNQGDDSGLSDTGENALWFVGGGLALVLVAAALIVLARKRQTT